MPGRIARRRTGRALLAVAGALGTSLAHGNIEIARLNGMGSCSTCHAADTSPTKATLNPLGLKYLGCNLNQACWDRLNAAVRTLELSPGAQPAAAPPRAAAPGAANPPAYVPPGAAPAHAPPAAAPAPVAAVPRGSYQNNCRDIQAVQDVLYGACANARNQTVHTALYGFPNCQSDIAVDADGYLVCNLRGGGNNRRQRFFLLENKGWLQLTQSRVLYDGATSWTQLGGIDLGRMRRVPVAAAAPCMVKAAWTADRDSPVYSINSCTTHRVLIRGTAAQFE